MDLIRMHCETLFLTNKFGDVSDQSTKARDEWIHEERCRRVTHSGPHGNSTGRPGGQELSDILPPFPLCLHILSLEIFLRSFISVLGHGNIERIDIAIFHGNSLTAWEKLNPFSRLLPLFELHHHHMGHESSMTIQSSSVIFGRQPELRLSPSSNCTTCLSGIWLDSP